MRSTLRHGEDEAGGKGRGVRKSLRSQALRALSTSPSRQILADGGGDLVRRDFGHAVVVAKGTFTFKAGAAGDMVANDGVLRA